MTTMRSSRVILPGRPRGRWVTGMKFATSILLLFAGCLPNPESAVGGAGGWTDECYSGIVGVTGSGVSEEVVLRNQEGGTLILRGGEELRLARLLTGGEVEVCGSMTRSEGVSPTLVLSEGELLRMDGMEAHLGMLSRTEEGWMLLLDAPSTPDSVVLVSLPPGLGEGEGQLVWIAGERHGTRFRVASFGILEK